MDEDDICNFCGEMGDSAEHQLFNCSETMDITHEELIRELENSQCYIKEIVAPTNVETQSKFVARVKVLISEYESLDDIIP